MSRRFELPCKDPNHSRQKAAVPHRSGAVKTVLGEARGAICLERLPGYAPDLNPDECVWQYLKRVQLANVCSLDLESHRRELRNAIRRFKRRQHELIPIFFQHAGL